MLEAHELRVVQELKELQTKHAALIKFIEGPEFSVFDNLPELEQSLLVQQESIMHNYIQVLATRVGLFLAKK